MKLDYSGKNPNREVEEILFGKTPLEFLNLSLCPKYFKLPRLEILQNCVTSLGNSKVKSQDLWKFHMIFS